MGDHIYYYGRPCCCPGPQGPPGSTGEQGPPAHPGQRGRGAPPGQPAPQGSQDPRALLVPQGPTGSTGPAEFQAPKAPREPQGLPVLKASPAPPAPLAPQVPQDPRASLALQVPPEPPAAQVSQARLGPPALQAPQGPGGNRPPRYRPAGQRCVLLHIPSAVLPGAADGFVPAVTDPTGAITQPGSQTIALQPGDYLVSYKVSATLNQPGYMQVTPSYGGAPHLEYGVYFATTATGSSAVGSAHFILPAPSATTFS